MTAAVRLAAARLAAVLIGIACLATPVHAVEVGVPAPPFTLPELDGEGDRPGEAATTVVLADLSGRVVLLDFWASWCAPCREALPFYSGLHRELSDRGLAVLAVNVDEHVEDARGFLEGRTLAQPMVRDAGWQVARRYGVSVLPASVLIDRRGVVRGRHVGFDAEYAGRMRALVIELLAEPAAGPPGGYTRKPLIKPVLGLDQRFPSPHFSPGAAMIAEDPGPVRVLATESMAGPMFEGARARTGPGDPRGRGQRSPYLAQSLGIVVNCLIPKSLLTPTSGLVRNAG